MTPETKTWLMQRVPELQQLEQAEFESISDFTFLWGLFEGTVLNCNCNMNVIREYAKNTCTNAKVRNPHVELYTGYLRDRYYSDGELSHHYQHLRFRSDKDQAEVKELLNNPNCSQAEKIIACFAIIYRLRNNLFHGEKWKYNLKDQHSNFHQANTFLRGVLECV